MSETRPSFEIPQRPERRYPRGGGVEYAGGTVFSLRPVPGRPDERLRELVEGVLADGPYTYGDWFDLPMPLYLVHDGQTGDTFRVAIRNGCVELHVLPRTGSAGLRALYERLRAAGDVGWHVECRTD